ncbi:MAG: creatininase family protein [Spiribacter sp.]|jgi:creatinine amidohydrolase|nr:creatininase family protein [Spiribacter sp.]MDR9488932.1 creatininase family protein [Spiribacter sp.]
MQISDWGRQTRDQLTAQMHDAQVALLPLGAIEQHGPHLPLATDQIIADGLVNEAISQLDDQIAVWRLPTLPIGQGVEHARHAGTLSLSAATFESVIYELGVSVARTGVKRLVLFSAHGGNSAAIENAALELRQDYDLLVVKACYFNFPAPPTSEWPAKECREGLHGGALETTLMLHFAPNMVNPSACQHWPSIDETALAGFQYLGAEHRPARFAWLASDINPAGVCGDARLANAADGEAFARHYAEVLAGILAETAAFPLAHLSHFD